MSLKIEYSSTHELFEIFKNFPDEKEKTKIQHALAQEELDTANMELAITTAEIIDEICKKRFKGKDAPATARQEIRRAEVQLDIRWKKCTKRVIEANKNANILAGRLQGMWDRGTVLEMLGKAELKMMYIDPTVVRDNRRPDTKANEMDDHLDYPKE